VNWTKILAEEAHKNSILRLDDLAKRYDVPEAVVRNALSRYESHGLVEHISNRIYINKLNQQFSPSDLVNVLRPDSYISLESALVDRGITNQSPAIVTCVTIGYPKTFRSRSATVVYRKIAKHLFWGFRSASTRYNTYHIAEPEKALLDWIYLNRQEGLPTPLDELNLQFLDLQKLRKYATRFPGTVNEVVKELLLDHTIVAA
jgi:predicted transcriptional regulator of viral defense system